MSGKDETLGVKETAHSVLAHTLLALGITLALLMFMALAILGGALPPDSRLAPALLAEFAGVFIAAFRAAKTAKTRKLPISCAVGLGVFIVFMLAGMFFAFPPAGQGVLVLLCALMASAAGGVLAAKPRRRRHRE